jgi:hypothetical protein
MLENKKGVFADVGQMQNIHSTTFLSPFITLAGTQNGEIYKFEKNVLKEVIPGAHNGAVVALHRFVTHFRLHWLILTNYIIVQAVVL